MISERTFITNAKQLVKDYIQKQLNKTFHKNSILVLELCQVGSNYRCLLDCKKNNDQNYYEVTYRIEDDTYYLTVLEFKCVREYKFGIIEGQAISIDDD